jgi:hypothetical protein
MKTIFDKGLSYRSFLLNQQRETRIKFMQNYIPMNIKSEHRSMLNSVNKKVRILGVVEGSCPDCQINLPVIEKLISTNNNIELRLITEEYLHGELKEFEVDGKLKLPTFIFMDEAYNIRGAFVEKPKTDNADVEEELTALILCV